MRRPPRSRRAGCFVGVRAVARVKTKHKANRSGVKSLWSHGAARSARRGGRRTNAGRRRQYSPRDRRRKGDLDVPLRILRAAAQSHSEAKTLTQATPFSHSFQGLACRYAPDAFRPPAPEMHSHDATGYCMQRFVLCPQRRTTARCDTAPTLTLRRDASPASPVDARLSRAPRLRLRLSMSRRMFARLCSA